MKLLPEFTKYAAIHYYKRAVQAFIAGLLLIVPIFLQLLADRTRSHVVGFFAVATFLAALGVIFHTVPMIIGKMEREDGLYLREAISQTFRYYAILITLVPVIGPILNRMFEIEKDKNPFENEDV